MKVPIKPKQLTRFKLMWRYIIIHDVSCNFDGLTEFYVDSPVSQVGKLRSADYIMNGEADINFHFVIEKIKDDYEVSLGRPMSAMCNYDTIPENINRQAIHIGAVGHFNYKIPDDRFYQQMAYKIVSPLMQMYGIPKSRIYTHSEMASADSDVTCPGRLFDKQKLIAVTNQMVVPF